MISQTQKDELIKEAKKALSNPYPKDTKTVYSCAVLTDKGNIYSSAQYFSDTYSLTLHAEQAALAHAASHGEGNIIAIAATSNEEGRGGIFCNPCHMCKQLLYESSRRSKLPLLIILVNGFNETKEVELNDIISHPWP